MFIFIVIVTSKKCEDNVSNVFATSIGPMVNEEEMNRENNKVENREVTKGNSIQYQSLIIVVGIIILLYINCLYNCKEK